MIIFTQTKDIETFNPKVEIKKRFKKVCISGTSRMTNAGEFYIQLKNKLEESFKSFKYTLLVEFNFEYVNTSSSKWIFILLKNLQSLINERGVIEITWRYEKDDEIIEELGEIFKSRLTIPFHLKPE